MASAIWILGDQLTHRHPAFSAADKRRDRVVLIESRAQAGALRYHKVKLAMVFSAMRHFAEELRAEGWRVDYYALGETPDFLSGWKRQVASAPPDEILLMEPNSFVERRAALRVAVAIGLPLRLLPPVQFLRPREDFIAWAKGKKRLLMEQHYRTMRERLGVLIEPSGHPVGGRWNHDAENRRTAKDWGRAGRPAPPELPRLPHDAITLGAIGDVERWFPSAPGKAASLWLPATRREALLWLEDFVANRLPLFGDYEDMMSAESPRLFHSLLSAPINLGLLGPMECVEAAVEAYRKGVAPLNAVEGFVRQIIGWREFVNGIYWLRMPGYTALNELGADRPLPAFFETGETGMRCLRTVLAEVRETGFNHHIQRLMVLGNFMLLAGVRPGEAFRWFSAMYVDAFDWVMAANVIGMTLHADGGFMATKPYAGSGAYIHRMSDYCAGCAYSPEVKSGPRACPYNLLYWHFYDRHADRFAANPRASAMVSSWRKRPAPDRERILADAEAFLASL